MEIVKINNQDLLIKMWNGQRVVTFKDIDRVHEKAEGTAKRNFGNNRKYLIENEDYHIVKHKDVGEDFTLTYGFDKKAPSGTLITEMGYLMLAKSFTGKQAWSVQRQLVNTYFKFHEVIQNFNDNYPIDVQSLNSFIMELRSNMPCLYAQVNNIEGNSEMQLEKLESVIDNMTLSTRQQQKIAETARKRVNALLGGAHSENYKAKSRSYMINLWNGLKENFSCGSSYKDLNPRCYEDAIKFIETWNYIK